MDQGLGSPGTDGLDVGLANVLDALGDAAFVIDPLERILCANRAAGLLTGHPVADLLGQVLRGLSPAAPFRLSRRPALESGQPVRQEWTLRTVSGADVPVEEVCTRITFRQARAMLLVVRERCATSQRPGALEVVGSGELYDGCQAAVFRARLDDGSLVASNPQLPVMLGYDDSDRPEGDIPWRHFVDIQAWERLLEALRRDGLAGPVEVQFFRRDGSLRWGVIWARVTSSGDAFDASMVDTTQIQLAGEALRSERDFANKLVETAPAMVLVLGLSGRILRANRFARRRAGLVESELMGREWAEALVPLDHRSVAEESFQSIVGGEDVEALELPMVSRAGEPLVIRWYGTSLRDADGRVVGVLLIGQDATEIVEAEQQLLQATKMQAIGRLAGGVAHDFSNQLTIVRGYCDLLLDEPTLGEDVTVPVRQIRDAADRAAQLTDQLLIFSRCRALHPQVVDVNSLLERLDDPLRRMLGEDIHLKLDLGAEIGLVLIDPVQFEHSVVNLVANARDAMPSGGDLFIETCCVQLDEEYVRQTFDATLGPHVMLVVRDTGCGMTEEVLQRIFEPFYTTKGVGQGTGLGLAAVYGFVRESGGHISVTSAPGEGTTFEILLPQTAEPVQEPTPERRAARPEPRLATVLVTEDSEPVRQLVVRVLSREGFHVIAAADAEEADAIARSYDQRIHLLLADVVLPGRSGPDLARRLCDARPGMKVLFMSGYSPDAIRRQGFAGEEIDLLRKPFASRELVRRVRMLLGETA